MTRKITKDQFSPDESNIPKGRNKSGRTWKQKPQKRASSLILENKQNARSKTWEKKNAERKARLAAKEREKELRSERVGAIIAKKERRLENEKKRMENEFKVASRNAQNLGKNADFKLKAMNKKQLRQVKKTRMNTKTGVVEYVSPYAK
mmetsp:Transcript_17665/g.24917  ORF Transcript_17665/g.24917 Transcript_17665/m.24917 type:complete len:149 (-) Transcript_17665:542-988(-)|eukprot:CAMPEP_0184855390 /NCGR_PEP_ID=MMETSP0580-20130426/663_1 /TAXON_ID=1118495 /ORGANISM="Dactyliosolen fragilissimus" /LENGTH=148 /DNA_ID=CAMNT_0027349897 /DNA_START=84 /DNA_END=530 /DNA_ORIENTATION=+